MAMARMAGTAKGFASVFFPEKYDCSAVRPEDPVYSVGANGELISESCFVQLVARIFGIEFLPGFECVGTHFQE